MLHSILRSVLFFLSYNLKNRQIAEFVHLCGF